MARPLKLTKKAAILHGSRRTAGRTLRDQLELDLAGPEEPVEDARVGLPRKGTDHLAYLPGHQQRGQPGVTVPGAVVRTTLAVSDKIWISAGRRGQLNTTASVGFVPRAASRTRVSQAAGRTTCVG